MSLPFRTSPLLALVFSLVASTALAGSGAKKDPLVWVSAVTGQPLKLTAQEPATSRTSDAEPLPTVFYLLNLAAPRVGTEPDDEIVRDLLAQGCRVVTVDFAHDPRARLPEINRDLARLRVDFGAGRMPIPGKIDQARVYLVPAGHRLLRDVIYYRDAKRTLAFDLIYPSRPSRPSGIVLEFSCNNKDRMDNTSLVSCDDTILDGEATEGFAVAMADHPVAPPYKGIDAMPDCARKIKAAVRTLRATALQLGLGEKIVPVGFSRGSGMALMLVTTDGMREFEQHGEHPATDSSVQGAVVMSGRFTYLDLLTDDHMIPRYEKTWGRRDEATDVWRSHGALDYLHKPTMPLFLTINCTEGQDALHQMKVLRNRLDALKSPYTYLLDEEPRGHKVTRVPAILLAIDRYLTERLQPKPSHP